MRRPWTDTFRDPAVLSDLLAAAADCMRQACTSHELAECDCRTNLMTPAEFASWVEREVYIAQRSGLPVRRVAGSPGSRRPNRLPAHAVA